jgi:rhodanese-related sulfurtransferase
VLNRVRTERVSFPHKSKKARFEESVRAASGVNPRPAAVAGVPAEGHQVSAAELAEFVKSGEVLILDARPSLFFEDGRIPGAVSLPRSNFAERFATARVQLEQARAKNWRTVVYCQTVQCEDSHMVAQALQQLGFANAAVLTGGFQAWKAAGQPVQRGTP